MKTILVPVEGEEGGASVLETALKVARPFDSYIEGIGLAAAIPPTGAVDTLGAIRSGFGEEAPEARVQRSRHWFESAMRAHAVPHRAEGQTGLSFGWHGDGLASEAMVGAYGRVFDLTVVARPIRDHDHARMSTVEAALFESGRPVLVAPPAAPRVLGRSVVIAWTRSTETARSVALAMPLLAKASRVVVLTVHGGTFAGPRGEALAHALRRNGVAARALELEREARPVGEAILAWARELDADLIVKGAYTQGRLRRMIFGDATRYLLEHASLPVLMAC